ncbi:MAG: oligoendopeptidase F [Clostridia bacterium]|nr:oligoendopeptidase F [Clostridia bacterium]
MKTRKEMDPQFMWELEAIYPDANAWEADMSAADAMVEGLSALRGSLAASASALADGLDAIYAAAEKVNRVYIYAMLHKESDNSSSEYQVMQGRAMSLYVKFSTAVAFADPEMLAAGADTLRAYLADEARLATYKFKIEDLIRSSEHILDEGREALLASLGEAAQTPNDCFTMLSGVDLEFPAVTGENGEELPLTAGTFGVYRESKCRAVREDAFNKYFGEYKRFKNTFAATYAGSVKLDCFEAKTRGYDSACHAALSGGNVPISVYDSLIAAVRGALPTMRKYLDLRARVMGKEQIDLFDLYVPMVDGVEYPMPYESAKALVKEALAPLGEDYAALLDRAYNEGWIDVYESKGKSSGAFSCGVYGVHPYVLLNYTDTLDDAFTLAHELGHSMHSYYSDNTQDYPNHDYRIMVAEVASTVNEVLLIKHLLKKETDEKRRAYILNRFLEGFRTTVFRQTLFAEFELRAHEMYEAGQPLTADSLSELYHSLVSDYYEGASINDIMRYEWSYVPHFYRAFYVYQYATGFCSAVAIAGKIAEGGDISGYKKFLTLGGSDYPLEELKVAGVDLTRPDAVADAMKLFDETVRELDALMK